jgi:hypothetical protein
MTTLQEIKDLARDSLGTSQRAAQALLASQEPTKDLNQFRDKLLELAAEALALYKVVVLQARRTESATDVAALWEEAHGLYAGTLAIWEPVAVSEPATRGLIEHYRQVLTRLKGATADQCALHTARTGLRVDDAARASTERLKEVLVHLPDKEFEALLEAREQAWDQQIEADAQAGKLDAFAQDALRSYREGNVAKLP